MLQDLFTGLQGMRKIGAVRGCGAQVMLGVDVLIGYACRCLGSKGTYLVKGQMLPWHLLGSRFSSNGMGQLWGV